MARPAETFSMAFVTAPNHETAKYCYSCFHQIHLSDNVLVLWCKNWIISNLQGIPFNSRSLASGLVSGKLAACVNILPGVTSVYEWEGKVTFWPKCIIKWCPSRSMRTQKCLWWLRPEPQEFLSWLNLCKVGPLLLFFSVQFYSLDGRRVSHSNTTA